jgi:flagellar hook-length control protein FliK
MNLLLGGGVFAGIGASDVTDADAVTGEALLAAIVSAPAEDLLSASGAPDGAAASELLAGDVLADALAGAGAGDMPEAVLDALAAGIGAAVAEDASANSAAVEALIKDSPAVGTATAGGETPDAPKPAGSAEFPAPPAENAAAGRERPAHAPDGFAKTVNTAAEDRRPADAPPSGDEEAPVTAPGTAKHPAREPRGGGSEAGAGTDASENAAAAPRGENPSGSALNPASVPESAADAGAREVAALQQPAAAARTETPAQPAQTPERPTPYSRIADEVLAAVANKNVPTTLSVRMEPAELGRVDVSVKLTQTGKLVIDITAESAKTHALLAGQTDRLVQALGLQNVQVESVSATVHTALPAQQPSWANAGRDMAFFMDMAGNGGREDGSERDGAGTQRGDGRAVAGIQEDGAPERPADYARRMDLTA